LAAIAGFEGYRSTAYNDGVGVQTIGYGTTRYASGKAVRAGDKITPDRALIELAASADEHQKRLARCITVPLAQREWDALVSWAYNVGTSAACNSTLVRRLNTGDYASPCTELPKWNKAGGKVLAGLVKRRAAEAEMYGCQPNGGLRNE
jgi:lysozyme